MTLQEIFDTVVAHLRKQGRKSTTLVNQHCVYRAPNGDKCAIGCLIRDEDYDRSIEGLTVRAVRHYIGELLHWPSDLGKRRTKLLVALQNGVGELDNRKLELLRDLQRVHDVWDGTSMINLEAGLMHVAGVFNLDYHPPISTTTLTTSPATVETVWTQNDSSIQSTPVLEAVGTSPDCYAKVL